MLIFVIIIVGITSLISLIWNVHVFRHFERDKRIEGKISLIIYISLSVFGVAFSAFLLFVILFMYP
ncbi:hypothetical protein [Athalassotoga saccharophila]|uniref:hypothetical protein n=1 Tax=Athalassotoga saccharophila TaxID=1441386 RepID=UPI00137B17CE|nr:hypothetical protein [Athalassotoga saccharophila]BBJ27740.1 hypothetical protein ATHSA_0630 [Athalassotoga saccharophila]